MTPLSELLARVEAASGPERFLDLMLYSALVPESGTRYTHEPSVRKIAATIDEIARSGAPPHYTASLDAALGLVEKLLPGWGWVIDATAPSLGVDAEFFNADVLDKRRANATAATPALALLSALLKALQAFQQEGRG